ncbi:MAG: hypothetical protein ACFE95_13415 [Candidatus Hodarchaeota archaeon]
MTKKQFEEKIKILVETFPELNITKWYQDNIIFKEFRQYDINDFNRIVQYIYRTQIETPTNLVGLMLKTAKDLKLVDPKVEIDLWMKVIRSQQVYLKEGWEKKHPEVTCLPRSPDPRYFRDAVEKFREDDNGKSRKK